MSLAVNDSTDQLLKRCISQSQSRLDLWTEFIRACNVQRMAEIGVYQGDFAAAMLERCERIRKYYMVDPWKHLGDWNKPSNQSDSQFEEFFEAAKAKTEFAQDRRVVLRGKTTDVIGKIPDAELDFAYIDGDHTLRGVTIDLTLVYPKVREGGFIGGDDFSLTMWQHGTKFEPSLVFPFAVYFAEAVGGRIYALPNIQFCMQKASTRQFEFVDLTGGYGDLSLLGQVSTTKLLKLSISERYPTLARLLRRAKQRIS